MICIDVEQGSPEWHIARLGIPTASMFDKIITGTGKPSSQANEYLLKLVVEWWRQTPEDTFVSDWMKRGTNLEPAARSAYEFIVDEEVQQTGLVYRDEEKLVSCSPDGLMDDRGLEIKCPSPSVHVGYLISGKIPNKYIPQVQGSMYITGLDQWDFFSYHPEMPAFRITVQKDVEFCNTLDFLIEQFIGTLVKKRLELLAILGDRNARSE